MAWHAPKITLDIITGGPLQHNFMTGIKINNNYEGERLKLRVEVME